MASRVLATIISMRDQFTAPAKKIAESTKAINREVRKTQNQMMNFGKNLVKVGAMGATAIAGITVASVKMGMEYSENVAKISTIADTSVVSMENMSKSILKLSNDTGASANALANDVYDAISSGVDTANAVNTVATTTKLAKAGFAETGKALDLMTTIVNGYGKSIKEADYISDILIQTQNQGKVTVADLSESMGKVIPTANASNVSLEQVASGYAIMTSNGIKAAEATTYMNSMLNEMMKSGTKASKAIKDGTGKSFQELMKSGKSLGDILKIMDKEAKNNGMSLADMFGSAEAGKSALVLSKNEGKAFNDMLVKMKSSTGETQKAFDKMNAEPIVKLRKATEQMKNKGIELGVALLPTVNKIMDAILKLTEIPVSPYIDTIFKIAKSTYEYISKNWSTIAPIIITISTAFATYKGIMIAMAVYTKAYAIAEAIKTAVLATGATTVNLMTIAQWALNVAMTANPIGLVIAGIAGLITIGILLYKNWDKIKLYCLKLWETMKGLFMAVWNNPFGKFLIVITNLFNPLAWLIGLGVALYKNWDMVKTYGMKLWDTIKSLWTTIWNNPVGKLITIFFLLLNPITAVITVGVTLYKNWELVKSHAISLWDTIKGFFTTLMQNPFVQVAVNILALLNPIGQVVQAVRLAIDVFDKLFGKKKGTNAKITVEDGTEKSTAGMKKYANGGIATKPSIFGDAGAEIAIPLKSTKRSRDLLAQANSIINKGGTVKGAKNGSNAVTQTTTTTSNKTEKTEQKVFQIIFQGDVYGFADFKEKVAKAMYEVIHVDGSNVAVVK